MKRTVILITLAVLFGGARVCLADSPQIGTWKLNESKSTFPPGATKNKTVVYERVPHAVKVTVDGVDGAGNPVHSEWTGKFDGKLYPLTGDPTSDMRSYRVITDRVLLLKGVKDRKMTIIGRIIVSRDGRTRTVAATAVLPNGKKLSSTAVYDKE
ncbi:MAG: hypothetical protein QOJ64_1448 [Acidobacteriota bacterium]|jgi:hypothetical protein|nr:hypothetical protein [Acidobacteriota bacterium]